MPASALRAVSAGVYTALNVPALLTLAPGGVGDDVPQGSVFPSVLYEVNERVVAGMGAVAGAGRTLEVDVRVHVFSQYEGFRQAQEVMETVVDLLKTPPAVASFGSWAIFHDETAPIADVLVAGVRVKELVAMFRMFVQEA